MHIIAECGMKWCDLYCDPLVEDLKLGGMPYIHMYFLYTATEELRITCVSLAISRKLLEFHMKEYVIVVQSSVCHSCTILSYSKVLLAIFPCSLIGVVALVEVVWS